MSVQKRHADFSNITYDDVCLSWFVVTSLDALPVSHHLVELCVAQPSVSVLVILLKHLEMREIS